jgi:dTDP-4-dehydrorhamnose reductase
MIWLIGNKGMLGAELSRLLEQQGVPFTGTDREVDITNEPALSAFAAGQAAAGAAVRGRIDWIINCAAYTAVDKAEDDAETCRRLNTIGPGNIARTAKKIHARLVQLSTDYVFDGNASRPYREDDPTHPIGVYGLTKREGELAVLENNEASYIVRTAWLYGEYGNNFVHTILRLMNERDSISVVNDQQGSPTWAADLSRALLALVNSAPAPGIYHYTNEGAITWFDFAQEIYTRGRRLGLITGECDVRPCTSAEYPARVTRPAYSVLDKAKIRGALHLDIPSWEKSLAEFLGQKKKT